MGKDKKQAALCHSTVNLPLFDEEDDLSVLEKCPLPEMHLMQGFVNHLFWNGLVPHLTRERALLWPQKLNLVAKHYQGEIFEGKACRELLKNAHRLMDPEIYGKEGPLSVVPYVSTFQAMDKIVSNYFSSKKIDLDNDKQELDKTIDELRKSFEATGVSKTLKIHVILDHLSDCLKMLNGNALGC